MLSTAVLAFTLPAVAAAVAVTVVVLLLPVLPVPPWCRDCAPTASCCARSTEPDGGQESRDHGGLRVKLPSSLWLSATHHAGSIPVRLRCLAAKPRPI